MKIVFIDTYPVRRGAQVFVEELSNFLEENGQLTYRYYLYKTGKNAVDVKLRRQDRCFGFDPNHFFEKIPTIHPGLIRILVEEIEKIIPDVILLNGSRTLKYGALAKQFLPKSIKWVSRVIDDAEFWNTATLTYWYYRNLVIPMMDASIGVSQASLDAMVRHYDFKKPTRVIHRVFDPHKFRYALEREEARRKLGFSEKDKVLLFLGNLTSQKRPDRFIEVMRRLAETRTNIKGMLVGDGKLRKVLEHRVRVSRVEYQEARAKSLESRVKSEESRVKNQEEEQPHVLCLDSYISFIGYQEDVSPYLAAADLLLLTSDTEGLPGIVLEAAHFSVPTVATEVGGIRECLVDGETGVIIPDRSVGGFAREINFLLDHPDRRNAMGEAARNFVDKNFQMEVAGRQYLDFFRSLER